MALGQTRSGITVAIAGAGDATAAQGAEFSCAAFLAASRLQGTSAGELGGSWRCAFVLGSLTEVSALIAHQAFRSAAILVGQASRNGKTQPRGGLAYKHFAVRPIGTGTPVAAWGGVISGYHTARGQWIADFAGATVVIGCA